MKIGLVSDSHGKVRILDTALGILTARDVCAVVHCGDICCIASVSLLDSLGVPVWLVAGNMDRNLQNLYAEARNTDVTFSYGSVELPLGDGEFLVATHGHDAHLLDGLIRGQQFPYVCHGHTHRIRDERWGNIRVICPGALYDPRHPDFPSAAILDTKLDEVTFYDISRPDTPIHVQP